jgi:hypothetical protein
MKPYGLLLSLSIIVIGGLFICSCSSGSPPITSKPSGQPLKKIQSPTENPLSIRSMRVDVGGYQLYVQCMGQGSPTVLFEAGLGDDTSAWERVQPEVSHFTQRHVPMTVQITAKVTKGQQLSRSAHNK